MHIVQVMLSRGLGGIEQAFIDHCEGLKARGHEITAVIHPAAAIRSALAGLGIRVVTLRNMGEWDYLAAYRLRHKIRPLEAKIVVAHGNRAFGLARKARGGELPIVAVAHNYNIDRFVHADAVFSITADIMRKLVELGVPENRIFVIPNMVRCHELPHRGARNNPVVIAAMGRFVAKKGFDTFIQALSILQDKEHRFRAVIGGGGEEEASLKKLAKSLHLQDRITFVGWVEDKKAFYSGADIFCLPSLHEPFGIVLLEAFMYGAPVVTSDSEGPRDIITPNYDALMVPKGDATALAAALSKLINDSRLCEELAANGFAKVKTRYTIETVAERMEKALNKVVVGL